MYPLNPARCQRYAVQISNESRERLEANLGQRLNYDFEGCGGEFTHWLTVVSQTDIVVVFDFKV